MVQLIFKSLIMPLSIKRANLPPKIIILNEALEELEAFFKSTSSLTSFEFFVSLEKIVEAKNVFGSGSSSHSNQMNKNKRISSLVFKLSGSYYKLFRMKGLHSGEVAHLLLIQRPRVQFSVFPKR